MSSIGEIDEFIDNMPPHLRRMFDPGYDPGTGRWELPRETLRERVDGYLMSQQPLRETGRARPVKYDFGGVADKSEIEELRQGNDQVARAHEALADTSPEGLRQARQSARRSALIQELMTNLLTRQQPGPNVEFVTIAKADAMMAEYKQAREEGYNDNQLDFIPLSAYHRKIMPVGKKPIRMLMENEFGILQMASNPSSPLAGRIVCIRDRDLGTGGDAWTNSHVTVPDDIGPRQGIIRRGEPLTDEQQAEGKRILAESKPVMIPVVEVDFDPDALGLLPGPPKK